MSDQNKKGLRSEEVSSIQHLWFGHSNLPKDEDFSFAYKVAKCVAAVDGLHEMEAYRLKSRMAAIGAPSHVIEEVEAFDVSSVTAKEMFDLFSKVDVPDMMKAGTAAFIAYEALSVSIGDGELSDKETKELRSSVGILGLSENIFDDLVNVVLEEEAIRKKRIGIISAAYGGSESGDSFRFKHSA
eukprot:CAMPEP_0171294476 /NCGR_PEP_ID=MMETSP0816-20121228/2987_1 /TAXON_ID=420281 /ORGANISM="Proboscia inermis, Strain CCAP1064/1" /LENGTH=184 /DNA_ID=CAMNT_0011766365 /DNA_START=188 /DNA_END=742 /DNA_ORIENTATION=-